MAVKKEELIEAMDKLLALYLKETNREFPDNLITIECQQLIKRHRGSQYK